MDISRQLADLVHYVDAADTQHAAIVIFEAASADGLRANLYVLPTGEGNNTGAVIEFNVPYDAAQKPRTWHLPQDEPVGASEAAIEAVEAPAAGQSTLAPQAPVELAAEASMIAGEPGAIIPEPGATPDETGS